MFRILTVLLVSTMLSACGGGGDNLGPSSGSGSDGPRGLEKIVNLHNKMGSSYKVNSLTISGANSERAVTSECSTESTISTVGLQGDASEISQNGACFNDYSTCTYVTGDAMLTTTLFGREFRAVTPTGDYSGVVTTDVLFTGSFKAIAGQKIDACDDGGDAVIPVIEGVYEGYRYDIDTSKTLDKQALVRSEKVVMDCLEGVCVPRDDNVIRVMTSSGFDLSVSHSAAAPYILNQFSTPDNTRGYQFWGTVTDDGNTITGLAFPVGTGAGYSECNAGECFFLSFYRVM
ncbi:hypothetical protein QWI17_13365 [Gilvimarinus sp. SDUM040013]|uniref:Lipoprotein n=1 Tax=Gilvimarinus gilvus TaxID=3058038 RepID=A0ABU4RTP3_9GAMM|nr:hypothetical protein [Gilvimarinus sp. SDUM040013]MDO3386830.1 hypothetical protein [Gilvimarinus sp. SDUM040013]MDX6848240.1 hypothetical protein [Gilvimarinus sp. SDUM040013]